MLKLVDLSNNNGPVDMAQIAAAGIAGVMLKLTEGTGFVDPLFAANWAAAGRFGLFRAAYCFLHMQEPTEPQADYFLEHLPTLGPGDGVAADVEWPMNLSGDLSPAALAWLERVESKEGFPPLLYSFSDYINRHLQAPALGKYPLWLASWGTWLPPSIGPWSSIALWQHSASSACPGVSGAVDESLIARDFAGLQELGKPSPTPKPAPPTFPTGASYVVKVAHFLRVLPQVNAPHAESVVMNAGDHLTAATAPTGLPSWTSSWRYVCSATGGNGYAFAPDLKLP